MSNGLAPKLLTASPDVITEEPPPRGAWFEEMFRSRCTQAVSMHGKAGRSTGICHESDAADGPPRNLFIFEFFWKIL